MLYTLFRISNTRLKLATKKNQAKAKQHPDDELLLLEDYLLSFPSFAFFRVPKIIGRTLKKIAKDKSILMRLSN